jgi:hypothetical protein
MTNANRAVCVAALVAAIAMGMGASSAEAARSRDALYPHMINHRIERWGKAGWGAMDARIRLQLDTLRRRVSVDAARRVTLDARRRAQ